MVEFFSLRILEFHGVRFLGACECSGSSPTHVYIKGKRYGISWVVEQKMPVGKLCGDVFRLDVDNGKGGEMNRYSFRKCVVELKGFLYRICIKKCLFIGRNGHQAETMVGGVAEDGMVLYVFFFHCR